MEIKVKESRSPVRKGKWRVKPVSGSPSAWFAGPIMVDNWARRDTCHTTSHPGPPYRSGGYFWVEHVNEFRQTFKVSGIRGTTEYQGPFQVLSLPPTVIVPDFTTELWAQGSTAIARARPGNAEVSLATLLGELRELPAQFGRKNQAKSPSYLGYEFGGAPLLDDLRKLYEVQRGMDARIQQLRRDNGKSVRRRLNLYSDTAVSPGSTEGPGVYMQPTYLCDNDQYRTFSNRQTVKYWFSGKFRYFIPDFDGNRWPANTVRMLYGLDVSPEVVWNLTPWSWLADYFGNLGDVMSNLSANAADDLVMEYGYVMGTKTSTNTYEIRGGLYRPDRTKGSFTARAERSVTIKQRVVGYPYSFGASPGSLSQRQVAILGALGLNKAGVRF